MPRNSIPIASRTVPENCYPFEEDQSSCQLPRSAQHEVLKPVFLEKFEILRTCPNLKGRRGLFKMQPSYRVGRPNNPKHPRRTEHDIMFEIMTHGPVQGSNPAPFRDFFNLVVILLILLMSSFLALEPVTSGSNNTVLPPCYESQVEVTNWLTKLT